MATWTNVPNSSIETDKPVRAVDIRALRDNPIAIAGGASGAPRIETNGIDDGAVTNAKLGNGSVSNAKLGNGSVSNAKLGNGSVSTAKIANDSVTLPKLERLAPGSAIRSRDDTERVEQELHSFDFLQNGVVRVSAQARRTTLSNGSLVFRRRRNGSSSDVASFTITSGTYSTFTSDIAVRPGDRITIIVFSNTIGRRARFQTNGGNLLPGSSQRLEGNAT